MKIKRKILIVGGTGFIGYHLSKKHLEMGDEVYIVDNLYKNNGEIDSQLNELLNHEKCKLNNIDLTQEIKSNSFPDEIDIVYHLAAINGTELFYEIPYEVAVTNLLISLNLLKYFENKKLSKIVFSSTSEIYAGGYKKNLVNIPTNESVPVFFEQPTDIRFSYGASKFISEFIFHRFSEKFLIPLDVIRYHNIYGPRMGGKHVMPQLIKRLRDGENPLKVFGADETRAFCFIDDAIEATMKIACTTRKTAEVFHVGNDQEEIKIRDLANLIIKLMGLKIDIKPEDGKSGSVPRRCPDISKLRKEIKFKPLINLENGLKKTIEWYIK